MKRKGIILDNPLLVIARDWYGCDISENRTRKLNRLWRAFTATLEPKQQDLFENTFLKKQDWRRAKTARIDPVHEAGNTPAFFIDKTEENYSMSIKGLTVLTVFGSLIALGSVSDAYHRHHRYHHHHHEIVRGYEIAIAPAPRRDVITVTRDRQAPDDGTSGQMNKFIATQTAADVAAGPRSISPPGWYVSEADFYAKHPRVSSLARAQAVPVVPVATVYYMPRPLAEDYAHDCVHIPFPQCSGGN
jgi:hypothetical protein